MGHAGADSSSSLCRGDAPLCQAMVPGGLQPGCSVPSQLVAGASCCKAAVAGGFGIVGRPLGSGRGGQAKGVPLTPAVG